MDDQRIPWVCIRFEENAERVGWGDILATVERHLCGSRWRVEGAFVTSALAGRHNARGDAIAEWYKLVDARYDAL